MKHRFQILSVLAAIMGVIQLYLTLVTLSLVPLSSALVSLLGSYAWSLIGDMWEEQQNLHQRVNSLG